MEIIREISDSTWDYSIRTTEWQWQRKESSKNGAI